MKGSVRRNDLVVRLHGEEFAILLPRTDDEQAAIVGEKVRAEVESTGFVTTSVGTAGLDLNRSLEDNLVNADMALYKAKDSGRNQVVRYEDIVAEQGAAPGSSDTSDA
jgi:diguanylate cyclase (GGDEF)-like protein